MASLLKLSHTPPVVISPDSSVQEAVEAMSKNRVGAIGVVEAGRLVGIFTERDVMERVVLTSRDPRKTRIRDVMTSPIETARMDDEPSAALERMVTRHIRHLPVTDGSDAILGMLSIRNVLHYQFEKVKSEADALEAYFTADGPGG